VRFQGRQLKSGYENKVIQARSVVACFSAHVFVLRGMLCACVRPLNVYCTRLVCPQFKFLYKNKLSKKMNTQNNPILAVAKRDKVAFVQACWHRDIVDQLRDAFAIEFKALSDKQVDFFEVPGAYEIPLHAKALAQTEQYAAVVAAGLVVDGGIYRHDFVASTVVENLMRVQMDSGMPVFSAVLTPHHFHSSDEHHRFFKEHFELKGKEAAQACVQTLQSLASVG